MMTFLNPSTLIASRFTLSLRIKLWSASGMKRDACALEPGPRSKRSMVLGFLCCFLNVICAEPPAQERYLQANNLYQQGEFKKAYDLYNGIAYKSPELLINMGNAAFELGRIPDALVAWRQAQKHLKLHDYSMIGERIRNVQQERDTAYHSSRFEKVFTVIDVYMRFIPQKIWELLFLILIACSFFLVSWIKRRSWGRILIWSLALLVVTTFLMVRYTVQNREVGFVTRDTHVHVNKDSQARIRASVQAGQEVEVRAIHEKWYLVTDGIITGWVIENDLQLV